MKRPLLAALAVALAGPWAEAADFAPAPGTAPARVTVANGKTLTRQPGTVAGMTAARYVSDEGTLELARLPETARTFAEARALCAQPPFGAGWDVPLFQYLIAGVTAKVITCQLKSTEVLHPNDEHKVTVTVDQCGMWGYTGDAASDRRVERENLALSLGLMSLDGKPWCIFGYGGVAPAPERPVGVYCARGALGPVTPLPLDGPPTPGGCELPSDVIEASLPVLRAGL